MAYKKPFIREALLLSRYSSALNYVSQKGDIKKEVGKMIQKLESEHNFNIDIERDKCACDEPDAAFTEEEWNALDIPI